jgi:hypothetical protein
MSLFAIRSGEGHDFSLHAPAKQQTIKIPGRDDAPMRVLPQLEDSRRHRNHLKDASHFVVLPRRELRGDRRAKIEQ